MTRKEKILKIVARDRALFELEEKIDLIERLVSLRAYDGCKPYFSMSDEELDQELDQCAGEEQCQARS